MTARELTVADRVFRGCARFLERPTLALVGPQPVLRRIFETTAPMGQRMPADVVTEHAPDGSLTIRPRDADPEAAPILYFHGGGFAIGSPRTHRALVAHLARDAGRPAVAARYRLAPEHPFPAARDDAFAAYRALVSAGRTPVALAGDSAGGCLALQVAQSARDAGLPLPRALALIAPIADLGGDLDQRFAAAEDEILIPPAWPRRLLRDYLPEADLTCATVSPLGGDLTGLPPTLIQVGSGEALLGDARRLVAAMDSAELEIWQDLAHVWHLHAGLSPAANRAIAALASFIDRKARE